MIINCTECGKEMSSYAKSCPNCGCPTKSSEEWHERFDETHEGRHVQFENCEENNPRQYHQPKYSPMPRGEGCFLQTMNIGCMIILGIIFIIVLFAIFR